MKFSVLLSTYYKEQPQFFRAALDSIFSQTLPAPEVVLVCDGPLTPELDALVEGYQAQHPEVFKVVRLEKNGGLGNALNEGIKNCSYDIIVRMDTDDISFPTRFERQINFLREHPEVDLLSSSIDEFVDSPHPTREARGDCALCTLSMPRQSSGRSLPQSRHPKSRRIHALPPIRRLLPLGSSYPTRRATSLPTRVASII